MPAFETLKAAIAFTASIKRKRQQKILLLVLTCIVCAGCHASRKAELTHIACKQNQLYEDIMVAYSTSSEHANRVWDAASKDSSSAVLPYILKCKGVGIGGAWENKAYLPVTERLNSKGYIDWKFRISKDISPLEREFIEWILLTRTNIEPTEFMYYKHGTSRPNKSGNDLPPIN